MQSLESLYRQEERLGDKLANMELHNSDELTPYQLTVWKKKYAELELRFADNQRALKEAERAEAVKYRAMGVVV